MLEWQQLQQCEHWSEWVEEAFTAFDVDGAGHISREGLSQMLCSGQQCAMPDTIAAALRCSFCAAAHVNCIMYNRFCWKVYIHVHAMLGRELSHALCAPSASRFLPFGPCLLLGFPDHTIFEHFFLPSPHPAPIRNSVEILGCTAFVSCCDSSS
jgi:hypothetical protein